MDNNNLGIILKARRREKGLTLTQLSSLSGRHASHIARIERGERFPTGHTLRRLAEPLGFSELELCKLAGFLSRDSSDDRIEKLKSEIKLALSQALIEIQEKIDNL